MRLVFAGTPPFAATALRALHDAGHDVTCVLTQPDRPGGRGMKLQASAVKQWASAHRIPVLQPRSLRLDGRWPDDAARARQALRHADPEVIVVAAYGLILPEWVLQLPRHGCLNIHASLLPRWRGAAPIQRAIEAGDPLTGITIMQMDARLDTGDILLTGTQAVRPDDTADALQARLAAQGAELIVEALARLATGSLQRTPQPAEGATYARKIDKTEAAIDWGASAEAIERRLRAFDPFPGASATVAGQTTKIWRARVLPASADAEAPAPGSVTRCDGQSLHVACGQGQLSLGELQSPGARRMPASQFLQTPIGRRLQSGRPLSEAAADR